VEFSDWQQVNGIYWPFTIKHSWGGKVDTVLQLTDIIINQSLDAQIFSKQ
jgi:hypothetical protein